MSLPLTIDNIEPFLRLGNDPKALEELAHTQWCYLQWEGLEHAEVIWGFLRLSRESGELSFRCPESRLGPSFITVS